MSNSSKSLSRILIQVALAVFLILAGLSVFNPGVIEDTSRSLNKLFGKNDVRLMVMYVVAVIEIAAGALLILDLVGIAALSKLIQPALLIIIIAWVVSMVMVDVLPIFNGKVKLLPWLAVLSKDTLILGALLLIRSEDR